MNRFSHSILLTLVGLSLFACGLTGPVESDPLAQSSGTQTTTQPNVTLTPIPPDQLVYATNPAVYFQDVTISPNTPSTTGGAPTSFTVSPALPAGLTLDPTTGIISGAPTVLATGATYEITASNKVGSTSTILTLSIYTDADHWPPESIAYTSNPVIYIKGTAIPPNNPTTTGGVPTFYSVTPALPAGLSLNPSTGVITGTPSSVKAQTTYTVTGTNAGGSTSVEVVITVGDQTYVPPQNLTYATNPANYIKDSAISPNSPSLSQGTPISFTVNPALPTGLSLNATTGVITGTPTVESSQATYQITAANNGGSTSVDLLIAVIDLTHVIPTNLTYSSNPTTYAMGIAITPNNPSTTGGVPTSYSINPALPTGLSLNATTGVITGTPTALSAQTAYTVNASNVAGSTSTSLVLNVLALSSVSAGGYATCARLSDGTGKCWGGAGGSPNNRGRLGNGTTNDSRVPVSISGLTNISSVAVGKSNACALLTTGAIACWGEGSGLGNGSTTDSFVPVIVSGITTATSVSSGSRHTCARLSDSTIKCWGMGFDGRLGNGSSNDSTTPVSVTGISNALSVSSGTDHSCALLSGGSVKCWGNNFNGKLGNGTTTTSTVPVVANISNVVSVASGLSHTCAVLSSGAVQCWGDNSNHQFGDGTTNDSLNPVTVNGISNAVSVFAEWDSSCALLSSGSVKCWGINNMGQLGDGTISTVRSTPVTVSGVSDVVSLDVGEYHACATMTTGSTKCWGYNIYGQLGNNTSSNTGTPTSIIWP